MKKEFVLSCATAFVFLYENLNHFFVIVVIGGYELGDAWTKAFRFSGFESAFVVGSFRAVPFLLLIFCALFTNLPSHLKGKITLWVGFVVSVIIVFVGYWEITEAVYTNERVSSTSAIDYFWVPITAILYSLVACVVTYLTVYLYEVVSKRV